MPKVSRERVSNPNVRGTQMCRCTACCLVAGFNDGFKRFTKNRTIPDLLFFGLRSKSLVPGRTATKGLAQFFWSPNPSKAPFELCADHEMCAFSRRTFNLSMSDCLAEIPNHPAQPKKQAQRTYLYTISLLLQLRWLRLRSIPIWLAGKAPGVFLTSLVSWEEKLAPSKSKAPGVPNPDGPCKIM